MPGVAAFDVRGERLVTLDESALTLYTLDALGKPTVAREWSCAALTTHLAPALPLEEAGVDRGSFMPSVGTTARLISLSAAELAERLFLDASEAPRLEPVLQAARALLPLPSRL